MTSSAGFIGSGTADTHYFGKVTVMTTDFRSDDSVGNLYTDGVMGNIATFYDNVTKGEFSNPTVEQSYNNLTTILGRTAAYKNSEVTWEQIMTAAEEFKPDLDGLKA